MAVRKSLVRGPILIYCLAAVSVVGATLVAALVTGTNRGELAPPAVENTAETLQSTLDLSTMTPRQAADRLFNRVMSATERGDAAAIAQFAPMAVSAYGRVTDLDADARFHLGLLYLELNDLEKARSQVEILKQSVPKHLLALVLEHDIASRAGDAATAARVLTEFTAAYESEISTARPEYEAHRFSIDRLLSVAVAP